MSAGNVPIPQGASVGDPQAQSVPVPQGASIGEPDAVVTDSMDSRFKFQNPPLTPEEMGKLHAAAKARSDASFMDVLTGKYKDPPEIKDLLAKDIAHQTESAQHSSYVQEQFKDKAVGAAVATAPVTVPLAMRAAVSAPAAVVTAAKTPAGQAVIKQGTKYLSGSLLGGSFAVGEELVRHWIKGLMK